MATCMTHTGTGNLTEINAFTAINLHLITSREMDQKWTLMDLISMGKVRKRMLANVQVKRRIREEEEAGRRMVKTLIDAEHAELERKKMSEKRLCS